MTTETINPPRDLTTAEGGVILTYHPAIMGRFALYAALVNELGAEAARRDLLPVAAHCKNLAALLRVYPPTPGPDAATGGPMGGGMVAAMLEPGKMDTATGNMLAAILANTRAGYAPGKVWPVITRTDAVFIMPGDWVTSTYQTTQEPRVTWAGYGDYKYMGRRPINKATWGEPRRIVGVPARGFGSADRPFSRVEIEIGEGKTDTRHIIEGEGVYRIVPNPWESPGLPGLPIIDACIEMIGARNRYTRPCVVRLPDGRLSSIASPGARYVAQEVEKALPYGWEVVYIDDGARNYVQAAQFIERYLREYAAL